LPHSSSGWKECPNEKKGSVMLLRRKKKSQLFLHRGGKKRRDSFFREGKKDPQGHPLYIGKKKRIQLCRKKGKKGKNVFPSCCERKRGGTREREKGLTFTSQDKKGKDDTQTTFRKGGKEGVVHLPTRRNWDSLKKEKEEGGCFNSSTYPGRERVVLTPR